jgi:hypothetical protein
VTGLAKAARGSDIQTVLTTVDAETFSGPLFAQIAEGWPDRTPIDRMTIDAWEAPRVVISPEQAGARGTQPGADER